MCISYFSSFHHTKHDKYYTHHISFITPGFIISRTITHKNSIACTLVLLLDKNGGPQKGRFDGTCDEC
jgi:hypothetical protein